MSLAISPDSHWLVTGSPPRLWDLTCADACVEPRVLRGDEQGVICLAIRPDGRWLEEQFGDALGPVRQPLQAAVRVARARFLDQMRGL